MHIQLRALAPHFLRTMSGFSPAIYLGVIVVALVSVTSNNFYLMELLVLMLLYAQFAASWDVLSGYTDQPNFGHALFIGGAAYMAALLNRNLGLPPLVALPISGGIAGLVGLGIGCLTLRLRGPYFALSTIVFAAVAFNLVYILWPITGGEEGLTGVDPFTATVEGDLLTCAAIFLISVVCLDAFARSHYGLILRATRHNEDAAQASGINTAYYKIAGFVVSGFFAGIGGAMYVHTHMQIAPGMLADSLSVLIVLLATVGGAGTIMGPILAAALLTYFDQWLRVIEEYRIVIYTGVLILLVYLNPAGFANSKRLQRLPWARRLLLGRNRAP